MAKLETGARGGGTPVKARAGTAAGGRTIAATGNAACAQAMRQINPDVVAAYPITPQTTIVEEFAGFVANGLVDTEYVNVESEHSAMSACIGASAAGSRVMTTTSSQGLALMWEMLYIAAGLRLPIVMHNVNRALSAPINIHCDHSDSMGARDSGWIQLHSENAQEAYDNTIQAIRIAEHPDVRLPVMVMLDGFIISHAIDRIELLEDEAVKTFAGEFTPTYPLLDLENPATVGPFALQPFYFEQRRALHEAVKGAKDVIVKVGEEYGGLSGRDHGLIETYRLDDAEVAVLVLGSTAGTTRVVVDNLRDEGRRVGMVKLRCYRPFPSAELVEAMRHLKAVAVLDRADSPGAPGSAVFEDLRSALYPLEKRPAVVNYVYGLGGRDTGPKDIGRAFTELETVARTGRADEAVGFLGLRE